MRKYARIEGGVIAEFFLTDQPIASLFHPSLLWIEVSTITPQPQIGWNYANGSFSPPTAISLDQVKAAKISALTAACNAAISAPVAYKSTQFQADEAVSQSRLKGVLSAYSATTLPTGFYWVDSTNSQIPMTYADLLGLAKAMADQGWAAYQHLQVLKAEVNAATDIAAVNAVTW